MKNLLSFIFLFSALSLNVYAQNKLKIAITDLKAGVGRTQQQVDGLSDMLTASLFETGQFIIIERTQVNKIIIERSFQASSLSNAQIKAIGTILGVDALLIGTVNFTVRERTLEDVITDMAKGEYNVDIRLVSVENGEILSAAGGNQYGNQTERNLMRTIALELTENLIMSNSGSNSKGVVTLYGYLYVYPDDLGRFSTLPQAIITAINKNNTHGFNDWRLPTEEEIALLNSNKAKLGMLNNAIYAHTRSFNNAGSFSVRLVRTGILVQKSSTEPVVYQYLEKTDFDFGRVPVLNGSVTVRITVNNPTRSSVSISSVNTNASWITADWTKNPISPGESGIITIRININGRQGTSINRSITATLSNDEKLTMTIRGNVE
jgi:hypothetical protein